MKGLVLFIIWKYKGEGYEKKKQFLGAIGLASVLASFQFPFQLLPENG